MFPRNKCSPLLVAAAHVICDSAVNLKHDISHRACITSCFVKIKIACNSMKSLTFLTQLFRSVSNDYEMKTKLLVMCAFSSVQINAKMVFFRYAAICAAHPFINYVNDDALYTHVDQTLPQFINVSLRCRTLTASRSR